MHQFSSFKVNQSLQLKYKDIHTELINCVQLFASGASDMNWGNWIVSLWDLVVQVSFGDMIACDNEEVSAFECFRQPMWPPIIHQSLLLLLVSNPCICSDLIRVRVPLFLIICHGKCLLSSFAGYCISIFKKLEARALSTLSILRGVWATSLYVC